MEGGRETSCVVNGTGSCRAKFGKVDNAIVIPNTDGNEENTVNWCMCANLPDYSEGIIISHRL